MREDREAPHLDQDDRGLRDAISSLPRAARRELRDVLLASASYREAVLRARVCRPDLSDLATLIAIAHTDRVARLRLLRGIRDVERLEWTGGPR